MKGTFKVDATPLVLGLPGAIKLDSTSVLLHNIENIEKILSHAWFVMNLNPNMIFQTFKITFRAIQLIHHWQFVNTLPENLHAKIVKELLKSIREHCLQEKN